MIEIWLWVIYLSFSAAIAAGYGRHDTRGGSKFRRHLRMARIFVWWPFHATDRLGARLGEWLAR